MESSFSKNDSTSNIKPNIESTFDQNCPDSSDSSSSSSSYTRNVSLCSVGTTYSKKQKLNQRSELPKKRAPYPSERNKTSLPIQIKRQVITNPELISLLDNSSNSATSNLSPSDESTNNLQETSSLIEKRKRFQYREDEKSRKKISSLKRGERVEKKGILTAEENSVKNLLGGNSDKEEPKRSKVNSRDSIDSGAYCSEASPVSTTAYSKDVEPSEIFSPDSTEIDCRKLKDLEILESRLQSDISSSKSKEVTLKKMDKIEKICKDKRGKKYWTMNVKRNPPDSLDSFAEEETNNETSVLPDSSTCISDDELTIIGSESPLENNAPGPSDDTLSKAGIVRDQKKNSYVFSSDKINALVNILTETSGNPKQILGNQCIDEDLDGLSDMSTDEEPLELDPVKIIVDQDETSSDIEIVMEKRSTATPSESDTKNTLTESKEPEKKDSLEKTVTREPPKTSLPRLRVKSASELGCQSWFPSSSSTNSPPLQNPPQFLAPLPLAMYTQEFSGPSTSSSVAPARLSQSQLATSYSEQLTTQTYQLINTSIGAKRLTSLMGSSHPNAASSFNDLISILKDISEHTSRFRYFYLNLPLGLDNPELMVFKILLKQKLCYLTNFLRVPFDECMIKSILNHYCVLTAEPTLNIQELQHIMSSPLSGFPLYPTVEHQPSQGSLPPSANRISLQPVQPTIRHNTPPNIHQNPLISFKKKNLFTKKQRITVERQIRAYRTIMERHEQLLAQKQHREAADQRTSTREPTKESISLSEGIEQSAIVFRMKATPQGLEIAEIENNYNRTGLVITPITTPSTSNPPTTTSKPRPSKSASSTASDIPPFPSNLTITAVITTTATPTISTMSTSVPNQNYSTLSPDKCTITVTSTASESRIVPSAITQSLATTPSVIVAPQTVPSAISSTLSSNHSATAPSVIVFQPSVASSAQFTALTQNPKISKQTSLPNTFLTSTSTGSATVSSEIVPQAVDSVNAVPLIENPFLHQTQVITSQNPTFVKTPTKCSTTTKFTTPTKFSTSTKLATPIASPRTYLPPKTNLPSSNPVYLSQRKKIPKLNVKDEATKTDLSDAATKATTSAAVETEFRSMPSLSPSPSPPLEKK